MPEVSEVMHETPAQGEFVSYPDSPFQLFQPYPPAGDQPTAIEQLVDGIGDGLSYQTLLGVTGPGKTFTMANVIARIGRSATKSLLERRDVVIVATVSAIYGIGNPSDYHQMVMTLRNGDKIGQRDV